MTDFQPCLARPHELPGAPAPRLRADPHNSGAGASGPAGGGLPTIWQAPMSLRSRLLRFAQPEPTLRSLLSNDMQFGKVRSDSLGSERRVEAGLIEQHCAGDGEQAVGNRSQGAPMTMPASA